jgi:energy-coupling factor transporter ATP-binding protein EcfA2
MEAPPPIWNARGSVWHRWDPHIHAPGTILEDRFAGDWEGYLTRIENASPPIRALGITDYYSIATYRQVSEWKHKGRLAQTPFIFPNVEMRLDVKTARQRGINIHLLFSPDDTNHEQEIERILSGLEFEYNERVYHCSRPELIALGRSFDSKQKTDEGAFGVGVNQFKVTFSELRQFFRQDQWLRENCLVAVVAGKNDGTSGLQTDDGFAATREEIQRFASIIFSGNPTDRDFWLGKRADVNREAIENKYGYVKPCIHGCDAHDLETVAVPDQNRFCWIKGDLAFETLRQAAIEPQERVWIGEQSPEVAAESIAIHSVETAGTPWLQTDAIQINRGLVGIIGARGSGKTALVDLIAAGAYSLGSQLGESSFLLRATTPEDLIGTATVTERWIDGTQTTVPFRPPTEYETEETPEVCYLSQHFVNELCSSAGLANELRREIERVIFEQTSAIERYETDSFDALSEFLLRPIRRRRSQQVNEIESHSDKIAEEERLRDQLSKLTKEHSDLADKIQRSNVAIAKLLPKGKEERAKRLLELEEECTARETTIEALNRRLKSLDELLAQVAFILEQGEPTRFSEMQSDFSETKLEPSDWEVFRMQFYGDAKRLITSAKKTTSNETQTLLNGDPKRPVDKAKTPISEWPLIFLRGERDKIKREVAIDAAVQKRYDTLKRSITTDQALLKRLAAQVKHAEGAEGRRHALIEGRRVAYGNAFETFSDEQTELGKLYGALHESLADARGALAKLRFVVRRRVGLEDWVHAGEELLDLRKDSRFRGHGALHGEAAKLLANAWQTGKSEDVASAMQEFVKEFWPDILKASPASIQVDERLDWLRRIGQWLYSTDHISIEYGIEYDSTPVERLSPGTRGIVLLLLYLAIDRSDRRPLLIDQPEENLDPKSVFDDLVPHFREARNRRQIIIVTHNANLVVNTDADQVIVATCAPGLAGGLPLIKYESGSLENSKIRRTVCDILEGGERAFLERERRYRLHWRRILEEVSLSDVSPSATNETAS